MFDTLSFVGRVFIFLSRVRVSRESVHDCFDAAGQDRSLEEERSAVESDSDVRFSQLQLPLLIHKLFCNNCLNICLAVDLLGHGTVRLKPVESEGQRRWNEVRSPTRSSGTVMGLRPWPRCECVGAVAPQAAAESASDTVPQPRPRERAEYTALLVPVVPHMNSLRVTQIGDEAPRLCKVPVPLRNLTASSGMKLAVLPLDFLPDSVKKLLDVPGDFLASQGN